MSNFTNSVIIGLGTNSDIDTAEETVVEITDLPKLTKTQLTIYMDSLLGTNTSLEYRFYVRHEIDGNYYQIPKQNSSDNTIDDYAAIIDASTPNAVSSHYYTVLELPLSSCFAFKVTAKGVGGANSTSTVKVMARDN